MLFRTLLVLVALPAAAHAAVGGQVTLSASSGITDNATAAPRDPPAGTDAAASDVFFVVEPTLALQHDSPRAIERLTLGVGAARYVNETEANSLAAHGALALDLALSPTMRLVAGLRGAYTRAPASALAGVTEAVPLGRTELATASADAALARDFSGTWRGVNQLALTAGWRLDDAPDANRAYSLRDEVQAQLSGKRDALQLGVYGQANRFVPVDEGGVTTHDEAAGATVAWLRELSWFWSLTVSGGAALVFAGDSTSIAPLARARIAWQREAARASVEVAHAVQANTLVARTFVTSGAAAELAHRLGPLDLAVFGGASHGTQVGGDDVSVDLLRFGASLGWPISDSLAVSLRHELIYQVSDAAVDATLLRNSVLLGLVARWPTGARRTSPGLIELRVRESEERERARAE